MDNPRSVGRYRPDIDGLRGIAVAAVVAFHAFPQLLPGGFVGVDVFLVISGFLISALVLGAVEEGRFSFREFYARRIRRLFPALVIVLAASLGAGWYVLSSQAFEQLGGHAAAASLFVANLVFWREAGYFDAAADAKPLLHLWSLGVEEQFYLTWPVVLAIAARRQFNVMALTLALVAISFAASVVVLRQDAAAAFYLPHPRAWELLAGALVAMWLRARGVAAGGCPDWLSAAGLGLIGGAFVLIGEATSFPGWWALAPVTGTCAVIAAGAAMPANRLLSHRSLVWLGLVSYPLYLWHWPMLSFARLALPEPPSAALIAALIAAALVLAWLTQWLVEQPIRFGRFKHSAVALATLVVCAAAVGIAGAATAEGQLAVRSNRFDRLLATTYDYARAYRGQTCQLDARQVAGDFAPACVDSDFGSAGRTSVLLWGDSHAAHLYPGLRAGAAGAGLSLAQFTADGCAPLVDEPTGFCRDVQAFVLERLTTLAPDAIVLAADWTQPKVERLAPSVAAIRRVTAAPIVLVGPVPRWETTLPQQLVVFSQRHPALPAPQRLRDGLNDSRLDLDAALSRLQFDSRLRYVSAMTALCNGDGCLAVVGDELTAFDDAHLTDAGSKIVAAAIVAALHEGK